MNAMYKVGISESNSALHLTLYVTAKLGFDKDANKVPKTLYI